MKKKNELPENAAAEFFMTGFGGKHVRKNISMPYNLRVVAEWDARRAGMTFSAYVCALLRFSNWNYQEIWEGRDPDLALDLKLANGWPAEPNSESGEDKQND